MAGGIVVFGSINMDLVVSAERLPRSGETVLGGRLAQYPGGKGANQAVAAARAGARVMMIGAVGDDAHGEASLASLQEEGIDVSRVRRDRAPTGVALIVVDPGGENQIAVAPGANASLTEADADLAGIEAGVLLSQLEVPMRAVVAAVRGARAAGMIPVVNPAPAQALPAGLLGVSAILTPNEHELTVAAGYDEPDDALRELVARNGGPVIVTQGAGGALLADATDRRRFPGYPASHVVDTTGAGDTFSGVLAAWLAEGRPLREAIQAANAGASLSVQRAGARSMPRRAEIEALLRGHHAVARA